MANKAISLVETQAEVDRKMLEGTLKSVHSELQNRGFENELLQEKLSNLDLMMDNQGWSSVSEYKEDGPDLAQVKKSSGQIRNLMALNPWIKRGFRLRFNYIMEDGVHRDNLPAAPKTRTGGRDLRSTQPDVQERLENPINQRNFFGPEALDQREGAFYSDSQALYIGDDDDYTLRALPLSQITADYRNPDDGSEIWAYRRTWQHYPQGTTSPTDKHEWIFCNIFFDKKTDSISLNGKSETVAANKRVFGRTVNAQTGWAYGIPDALPAIAWVKLYRDFLVNGYTVTASMAQIWAQAKNQSKAGADLAVAALNKGGAGKVAVTGDGNLLTPLSTAGHAYDFEKGNPLIAAAATAVEVSAIAITADTSAAGSSYGSAQTLDPPTRLAMESRRDIHVSLEVEVLKWMGADAPKVWFTPYTDSTEIYREIQAIVLKWTTGLYTAEEAKKEFEALAGRYGEVTIPDGILLPNNEKSLARKDIDTDSAGTGAVDQSGDLGTGAPGQGKNSPAGGGTGSNDTRTDTLT
jgi:hypothetical protein